MSKTINFNIISNDEYKKSNNFDITYGITYVPFGKCLIGLHDSKVCHISLHDEQENSIVEHLKRDWPNSQLQWDNLAIQEIQKLIFETADDFVDVLVRGTELQLNTWRELTKLREGTTVSYEQMAKAVGKPKAIRAVASAIAKNRLAYLVPCHRVISKTGAIHKYRWGAARKKMMLESEAAA